MQAFGSMRKKSVTTLVVAAVRTGLLFSLLACKRLGQNKPCNNRKQQYYKESEERGLKCQPEWHSLIYIMFCILVIGDDESNETCKKARNTPKT
jgi:hypothetical protein